MQVFENREEMISAIVPKDSVGCELGVYAGEFAEFLFRKVYPKKFYLIDGWDVCGHPELFCADQNGNGGCSIKATLLEQITRDRFNNRPNVHILKGWTHEKILEIPDDSLDWVYIDADHSYEGCLRDLKLCMQKVKKDGLIMGHDYEINKAKCKPDWKFGVGQAVDEILKNYPYELIAKGMDGCVSFALKRKN